MTGSGGEGELSRSGRPERRLGIWSAGPEGAGLERRRCGGLQAEEQPALRQAQAQALHLHLHAAGAGSSPPEGHLSQLAPSVCLT